jgi:error-prone DNA polymerase
MAYAWPHLQVASSYSLQYGTSTPQRIIDRAVADGHGVIGLADRDGLYGAVQWVRACERGAIATVLGVDLAVESLLPDPTPSIGRRTPARGGQWVDEHRPRVVLLAKGRRGWASLCRVVSIAHGGAHTERGLPWLPWKAIEEHGEGLVVLLGWTSEFASHLASGRCPRLGPAPRAAELAPSVTE